MAEAGRSRGRTFKRKMWYKRQQSFKEKPAIVHEPTDEWASEWPTQITDSNANSSEEISLENIHSVLICGVTKLERPYYMIRRYLREHYGLIPSDIEINRDQSGVRTGTAAVHFPFERSIGRIFDKSRHQICKKKSCKISPLHTSRNPRAPNNPILNKNIGTHEHRITCIFGQMTSDNWYIIIKYLDIIDLFRFQMVCSCARNVTNLYFNKKRTEFKFEHNEIVQNFRTKLPMMQYSILDYSNVMNIVMRHNLTKVVRLTLDMQSAQRMELENNFFQLINKHCPKLRHLKVVNALLTTWKSAPRLQLRLDSLELTNHRIHCYSRKPILTEESARAFFGMSLKSLNTLILCKWSPDPLIFKHIPETLINLKLTGHFDELPTEMIAEHLPFLKSLTIKVETRGMSTAMTHHHFLKFECLEELNLKGYPIYYDSQWILPNSMRVAYFVPNTVKKLTLTRMGVSASSADLSMITNFCPHLRYLKLKDMPASIDEVDFKPLQVLETLILDNVGSAFPVLINNLPPSIQVLSLRKCPASNPEILRLIFYVHRELLEIRTLDFTFEVFLMTEAVLFHPDKSDNNFIVYEYGTETRANEIRYCQQYTIQQELPEGNRQWVLLTTGQWDPYD